MDLVKTNSPSKTVCKFDTMLVEHRHYALRFPPGNFGINAIEYVWADMKKIIYIKKNHGGFKYG